MDWTIFLVLDFGFSGIASKVLQCLSKARLWEGCIFRRLLAKG